MTDHLNPTEVQLADIASAVVAMADAVGENPLELGLSVEETETRWWVHMEMDYPYEWPAGTGRLVWEGMAPLAPASARHAAMQAEFRRLLAAMVLKAYPTWEQLAVEQQQILAAVQALQNSADYPPNAIDLAVIAEGLADLHARLEDHWTNIAFAVERERDAHARLLGINRYAD